MRVDPRQSSAQSPLAVANYFLLRGKAEKVPIDAMKLQKLIYFAHGWHLAVCSLPLIDEPVEAWQYGPVIPSVYHEFKRFGAKPISEPAFQIKGGVLDVPSVPSSLTETAAVLDRVWQVYKHYSGIQLSNLTHRDNTPWSATRKAATQPRGVDIPDREISAYFRRLGQKPDSMPA